MDSVEEKAAILERSEIFLGLSNEAIRQILTEVSCQTKVYGANQVLFTAGDIATEFYILEYGEVHLVLSYPIGAFENRVSAVVDTVCTGGSFGWSAIIAPHTYTISAVCSKPSGVLALDGKELRSFLDRERIIGYEIMKTLSCIIGLRLRDSNRALLKIIAARNSTVS